MNTFKFLLLTGIFIGCTEFTVAQAWKEYIDSAKQFYEKKDPENAIAYYTRGLLILQEDSFSTDTYSKTATRLADLYFAKENFDSSLFFHLQSRSLIEKLHDKENAAYAQNSAAVGRIYFEKGRNKEAEFYFKESRAIRARVFGKDSLIYALSCIYLGNVYSKTGEYDKAEPLYLESMKIREKVRGKDSPEYAQSCNNLADLYRSTGQYEKAEPLALLAKEIRGKNEVKEPRAYAISCTNLANLYRDMGQYEKAEQLYIEAKQIRKKNFDNEKSLYASSCNILADLYEYREQYDKAEPLYQEALKLREQIFGNCHRDYAQTCNNLANMYYDMGQYEKATPFALEARDVWAVTLKADDPAIAINNNLLGNLYGALGNYKIAETYFLQAKALLKEKFGKDHPLYIANSSGLGRIYWNTNQRTKANELYIQIFNARYKQLINIFQFTNENEKQLFLKNINGSGDEFQSFYYDRYSHSNATQPYTISLSSRNLILSATRQQRQLIYQNGDSALIAQYNNWLYLKQQIASLSVQAGESRVSQITGLENAADSVEKSLVRSSTLFKNIQKNSSWKLIQQSLTASEAAIEFISFRYYNGRKWTDSTLYAALIVRKNMPAPQLVLLFEKSQLDSLLQASSNNLPGELKLIDDANNRRSLYKLIWRPVEKYLTGIQKVYFAPSGELFKIPFSALQINSTQLLSDKYLLEQLNSTASIIGQRQSFIKRGDLLKLYGGILYDVDSATLTKAVSIYHKTAEDTRSIPGDLTRSGFNYLPGTSDEVNEIKQSAEKAGLNTTLFSGAGASEESFKALSGKASPNVLHIATHGFFFPDPKDDKQHDIKKKFETSGRAFKESGNPLFRSGLLFAGANNSWKGRKVGGIDDGILTAYEVAAMYLPNTKLVVLSACQTALGDIQGSEGVYGLQRAFKMAGVQNLVMSLWKVPDSATAGFMELFYKNLFSGKSITMAFYKTQKTMKDLYRREPYKWAAWILVK